jgi:peptidoglycan/LPS O-acetylase OafA/YrhL
MSTQAVSPKLLNVQCLRAYGALAVTFYHTNFTVGVGLGLPIGSFGVSIFFVISGFIMAMICDTAPQHFLARRVARIVPLYWVFTIAVFLVARAAPGLMGHTNADAVSLLKSLLFIPYVTHGTYFPILFLGWSLNYEMYFYVLVALSLAVYKKNAVLVASGMMIFILLILRLSHVEGAAKFYSHPIILEFVLGMLGYYVFRVISSESISINRTVLIGGLFGAAAVMILTAIFTVGPVNAVIVGITATVLVFCAVLLDKAGVSWKWPWLILLGDASYVIYLVHPYIEEAFNKVLAPKIPFLHTSGLSGMPIAIVITILASIVIYRFVDNPMHLYFRKLLCPSPERTRVTKPTAATAGQPKVEAEAS